MVAKRSKVPEEFFQRIKNLNIEEILNLDPEHPDRLFVSNIFQRTLAHLYGKHSSGSIAIECDASGNLKTTAIAEAPENSKTTDLSTSVIETTISFSTPTINVMIAMTSGAVKFKHSIDGTNYSGYIKIVEGGVFFASLKVNYIKIERNTGTALTGQVIGFY